MAGNVRSPPHAREIGRTIERVRDGALRVAIKRHKNKEKSETLIAVAAALASMAVLGLV